jgi:hypothetical protein
MKNWNQQEVDILRSKGGVIALADPFDNLITTGIKPWPPSEIVQKLYQSRHISAFAEDQKKILQKYNGYYSDIQSIHSEDAITWSVFGTVARSIDGIRNKFISELFNLLGIRAGSIEISEIFLWRRIPHPDTLVSGGPEIDFGILTKNTLLLGEAKWKSPVGTKQGKNKDKDQIQLRMEFLQKYADKLYPNVTQFVVLGVGPNNDVTESYPDKEVKIGTTDKRVKCIGATWQGICSLASHPHHHELLKYLDWKTKNTK